MKTPQKSIPRSRNQVHRILSKFVHSSFMTLITTYYDIENILAVKLQKNGRFRCFFHISSNKKVLTAQIFVRVTYVVISIVIEDMFIF